MRGHGAVVSESPTSVRIRCMEEPQPPHISGGFFAFLCPHFLESETVRNRSDMPISVLSTGSRACLQLRTTE